MINSHLFEQPCYDFIMNGQEVFLIIILDCDKKVPAQSQADDRSIIETVHRTIGRPQDSSPRCPLYDILPFDRTWECQHSIYGCVPLTKNTSSWHTVASALAWRSVSSAGREAMTWCRNGRSIELSVMFRSRPWLTHFLVHSRHVLSNRRNNRWTADHSRSFVWDRQRIRLSQNFFI